MILIVITLAGVLSVALTRRGKLRRLAVLPLHRVWVVWLAVAMQIVIFGVLANTLPDGVRSVLHLVTYAIALSFLWFNRHLPGAMAIGVGAGCNLAAITANGGVMPASSDAWERAGFDAIPALENANSHVVGSPKLAVLGDIFAVPEAWPLSNVFSIGDVIIAVAASYLAHRWCRAPRPSERAGSAEQPVGDACSAGSVGLGEDAEVGHPLQRG